MKTAMMQQWHDERRAGLTKVDYGPWLEETAEQQHVSLQEQEEEIAELMSVMEGVVDLAAFWINRGLEPGMSEERHRIWSMLGHHSNKMRRAVKALRRYYDAHPRPEGNHDTSDS